MDNRTLAKTVDITVDNTGKLWVNVDGECVLRIGHCEIVVYDGPIFGRQVAYVDRSDSDEYNKDEVLEEALRQHQNGEE